MTIAAAGYVVREVGLGAIRWGTAGALVGAASYCLSEVAAKAVVKASLVGAAAESVGLVDLNGPVFSPQDRNKILSKHILLGACAGAVAKLVELVFLKVMDTVEYTLQRVSDYVLKKLF